MLSHIHKFSSQPAFVLDDGTEITYSKLLTEVDHIANAVHSRRLAFNLCRNSFETVCGYLGLMKGNIVQLLLNERITKASLKALIDVYRPSLVFFPQDRKDLEIQGQEILRVGGNTLLRLE